jgi:hypothetical protein
VLLLLLLVLWFARRASTIVSEVLWILKSHNVVALLPLTHAAAAAAVVALVCKEGYGTSGANNWATCVLAQKGECAPGGPIGALATRLKSCPIGYTTAADATASCSQGCNCEFMIWGLGCLGLGCFSVSSCCA